jgi:hypothetical protein
LNGRDWNYIEARLLAPAVEASDAYGRLQEAGCKVEADELMEAMKVFLDACRTIRNKVRDKVYEGRRYRG